MPASVSGPQENSTLDPGDFPSFPKVTDWCYRAQLLDPWLDFDSVGLLDPFLGQAYPRNAGVLEGDES